MVITRLACDAQPSISQLNEIHVSAVTVPQCIVMHVLTIHCMHVMCMPLNFIILFIEPNSDKIPDKIRSSNVLQ